MSAAPPSPSPDARPRRFAPRRVLPNGRAVVGAVLVTVAAIGSFVVATGGDEGPTTEFVVLGRDIEPGEAISRGDLVLEPMLLSPAVAEHALRSTAGVDGALALRPLPAGSLVDRRDLRPADLVDGSPVVGVHELTLPVPRDRTPGVLHRGDRVTVLAHSTRDGVLRTALEDALVLSFDGETTGIGASDRARLTLALGDADDVARATLLSYDELTVVRTTGATDDPYPAGLTSPTTTTEPPPPPEDPT